MCVSPVIFLRIRCVGSVVFFFLLGSVRSGARGLLCRIIYKWRRVGFESDFWTMSSEQTPKRSRKAFWAVLTSWQRLVTVVFCSVLAYFCSSGLAVTAANPLLCFDARLASC